jgi:D-glycero-alpha-D-manno-heptose 1-phosphate guanylyltransferase
MAICEAIILAGGLGTRLQDAVPDVPKCMAPVNGKPFFKLSHQPFAIAGYYLFYFCIRA